MNLGLKGFAQLVEDMGAALQSSASNLVDVSIGSVIRAIFEANASVVLWLQWLVLQVLQTTRASTSTGPDLDSWMADFGLERLPAIPSSGSVIFSRLATNLQVSIPLSSIVKTGDGRLSFIVTEDSSYPTWQQSSSSYVMPVGVAVAELPIICRGSGAQGNVLGGSINVIASSLPGVDSVLNTNPLINGTDAESDQAFRDRFQDYLASRSRATVAAVRNAIACVQQNLQILVKENTAADGTIKTGAFLIVVDDGTGHPSPSLLSNVANAVDAVRPIGTMFAVVAPTVMFVNVKLSVSFSSSDVATGFIVGIQSQVAAYLNTLAIGRTASVTRVAQRAYVTGLPVDNVTNVQLNGLASDVVPSPLAVIKAGQIVVAANAG